MRVRIYLAAPSPCVCIHHLGTYLDCEPCIEMCLVSLSLSQPLTLYIVQSGYEVGVY